MVLWDSDRVVHRPEHFGLLQDCGFPGYSWQRPLGNADEGIWHIGCPSGQIDHLCSSEHWVGCIVEPKSLSSIGIGFHV